MRLSRIRGKRHPALIGAILLLTMAAAVSAKAKTFVCDAEDVLCLIQSINEANTNGHPKNTIHLPAGTYTLSAVDNRTDGENGLPSITSKLTIDVIGNGKANLDRASGSPIFRFFHVSSTGNLTLHGLTLTHAIAAPTGRTPSGGGGVLNHGGVVTISDCVFADNAAYVGGGVNNYGGFVRITNSTFINNLAESTGGVENDGGSAIIVDSTFEQNNGAFAGAGGLDNSRSGDLRLIRTRVTDNHSGYAAGGLSVTSGSVFITETTFRGNNGPLGGIWAEKGPSSSTVVVVTNSSFEANTGVTIFNRGSTLRIRNTTFAAGPIAIYNTGELSLVNSTLAGVVHPTMSGLSSVLFNAQGATTILKNAIIVHDPDEPLIEDCQGTIMSRGNNIIGDLSGCTVNFQPGDLTGDAGLGPFTDDGAPGNGHFPLLRDSQAIDAGNDAFCPKRDQLGEERHGQCDIGAIEFQPKKHGHHEKHDHDESDDSSPLD